MLLREPGEPDHVQDQDRDGPLEGVADLLVDLRGPVGGPGSARRAVAGAGSARPARGSCDAVVPGSSVELVLESTSGSIRRATPIGADRGRSSSRPWTSVIAIESARPGAGPSPIRTGRSSSSEAGRPWLPRTSEGSSGMTSKRVRKPSFFAEEPARDPELGRGELRVEEQLARVVARLPVDVDRPGVVGGPAVVEPERVGEPGVGLGEGDDLARPRVVEPDLAPRLAREEPGDARARRPRRSRTRARSAGSRTWTWAT